MRLLVVSALAATLAGCSVTPHQMQVDRTPRMKSSLVRLHHRTATKIEKLTVVKKRKSRRPTLVRLRHRTATEKFAAAKKRRLERHLSASVNANTATPSAVATYSIGDQIKKAKEMITAKLGNQASIKFPDIAAGKAIDSICGEAEVKGASGETREMPFVVQKNEVYIINGNDDLKASRAIHKMCD